MKILLVEPSVSPFDVPTGVFALTPPHHLERLAGALVGNHDVRIFDMRIEKDLNRELQAFCPDFVGCSCVAANSHIARKVFREAKRFNPAIKTVVGGHHPSLMPDDFNDPDVDYVVIGEGEETLRELVEKAEKGLAASGVRGIGYGTPEGDFKINPRREFLDMDLLPSPARALTAKYRAAKSYFRGNWRPVDCTITSRGCPFKCDFCGLWKINHGSYRCRSPENVVAELATIAEPHILFFDDNTLSNVPRAMRMAQLIEEARINKKYEIYSRADTIAQHPELVEKWSGIGMQLLLIGLESCDDSRLDAMNKRTSTQINRRAIEVCHANGVEIVAYFIVRPDFDRNDFRVLAEYVKNSGLTHPVFTVLVPFPGTDLYARVKHTLTTKRLELFDFYHTVLPTKLPLDEFYDEFLGLYRKAYPTSKFIQGIFTNRSVLSPRMIGMNLRFRKRMHALRGHHDGFSGALDVGASDEGRAGVGQKRETGFNAGILGNKVV